MKLALVMTTISVPKNLGDYCKDILKYGHRDIGIIVAGDKKTPLEAAEFCATLARDTGIAVHYMGVGEQDDFLSRFPDYKRFLPWNCIQRRNVAILKAYSEGAEIIYTIDDDNFLHTPDYIGSHGVLGQTQSLKVARSSSGWLNICAHLRESRGRPFFHRGYSYQQRLTPEPEITISQASGRVVVNAGLWLGDPDVDAVTRLALAPEVVACELEGQIALAINTISPFNSQNTALMRDVIPAYCMHVGMGRYDDIVPSYVVKRIADHLGDYISFGVPVVRQERNMHDLWLDADQERVGYQLIDRIVETLYSVELRGKDYTSCMQELLPHLRKLRAAPGFSAEQTRFLEMIERNYTEWLAAIDRL